MSSDSTLIVPGVYRHFKGGLYRVYACATNTESGEELVFYRALYGDRCFFVRPLRIFTSSVDREKYPETSQDLRFELVEQLPGLDELDQERGA